MIKNQYGGRLDCGISDNAPSILLLGHGCEYTNNIVDMPEGYVYVTKAICGKNTVDDVVYYEFVRDFFDNDPFFNSPCKNYFLSTKYSYNEGISNTESSMNFHYKRSPSLTGRTYPEFKFTPLGFFQESDVWYCYKSGIYINKNK